MPSVSGYAATDPRLPRTSGAHFLDMGNSSSGFCASDTSLRHLLPPAKRMARGCVSLGVNAYRALWYTHSSRRLYVRLKGYFGCYEILTSPMSTYWTAHYHRWLRLTFLSNMWATWILFSWYFNWPPEQVGRHLSVQASLTPIPTIHRHYFRHNDPHYIYGAQKDLHLGKCCCLHPPLTKKNTTAQNHWMA